MRGQPLAVAPPLIPPAPPVKKPSRDKRRKYLQGLRDEMANGRFIDDQMARAKELGFTTTHKNPSRLDVFLWIDEELSRYPPEDPLQKYRKLNGAIDWQRGPTERQLEKARRLGFAGNSLLELETWIEDFIGD
jgi:hypothetical protein